MASDFVGAPKPVDRPTRGIGQALAAGYTGGATANKWDDSKVRMELFPPSVMLILIGGSNSSPTPQPDIGDCMAYFSLAHDNSSALVECLFTLADCMGGIWKLMHNVSVILTFGAHKYGDHNWRKGMKWSRLIGAAFRHLAAHRMGEENDEETGKPHLWHFACCVVFLLSYVQTRSGTDDRYRPEAITVDDPDAKEVDRKLDRPGDVEESRPVPRRK